MRPVVLAAVLLSCCSGDAAPRGHVDVTSSGTFRIDPAGDGRCEFDYESRFVSLDRETGAERWVRRVPYSGDHGFVVIDGQIVLRSATQSSGPASAIGIDASSGSPVWQRVVRKGPGGDWPALVMNRSLITPDGQDVVAIDLHGEERWRASMGPGLVLAASRATVVAGTSSGEVGAFDLATGERTWTRRRDGEGGLAGVAVAEDVAVTGTQEGALVGLDLASGDVLWEQPQAPGRYWSPLLDAADGVVVVADSAGNDPARPPKDPASYVLGLDLHRGVELWRFRIDQFGVERDSLHDDLVVARRGDDLVVIETSTGQARWSFPAEDVQRFSLVRPDLAVIARRDRDAGVIEVVAVDAKAGSTIWSQSLVAVSTGPVADGGDVLYLGAGLDGTSSSVTSSNDGFVTALATADGSEVWRAEQQDSASGHLLIDGDAVIALTADPTISCD